MSNESNRKLEPIEWCNIRWFNADKNHLPRILLIGDSITLGCCPVVCRVLENKADVSYLTTSKGINDVGLLKETMYVMDAFKYDVVHFNNGLHGWHIESQEYETALRNYVEILRQLAKGTRIIYGTTTANIRQIDNLNEEKNSAVIKRNIIAKKVMKDMNVRVNDLYELTSEKKELFSDGIHYIQEGYEILGNAVAGIILDELVVK